MTAWTTRQSQSIPSRSDLVTSHRHAEARWAGRPIPRPESCGGYCLAPEGIEFWHRYENRLHDRLRYERSPEGWRRERLAP